MTLCLAVATEHFGLVAFDGNGHSGVFRLGDGVLMTGCGRQDVLAQIARQLVPAPDAVTVLAPVVAHVGALRLAHDPDTAEQVRGSTVFVAHRTDTGYVAGAFACDGWGAGVPPSRGVIGNWPPGVGDVKAGQFRADLQVALDGELGDNPWATTKLLAAHALEVVRLASRSVYGILEVAVSFGGKDYYLSRTPCDQLTKLAAGLISRRFEELAPLAAPVVCEFASRVLALSLVSVEPTWEASKLKLAWRGNPKVRSVKVATSTTAHPAVGTGTVAEGNVGVFDAGSSFAWGGPIYITVTPYSGAGAGGVMGEPTYTQLLRPFVQTMFDDATGKPLRTTAFNDQGSLIPFVTPANFFTYASGGPGAGQMWISFDWTSQNLLRPDGTSATVPVPPAAPTAPTLSQVAGGALGARTRYAKIAYLKTDPTTGHETLYPVSAESSFAISANNLLNVTALADPGNGLYSGWAVLVGSASGSNYVQGVIAKRTFGVDWTEPAGGFSTTQNSLWTASWKKVTKIGLDPSTAYQHYPFYDVAKDFVYIPAETTNRNASLAILQHGDGAMSLGIYNSTVGYSGVVSISTPAGAGSGSGSTGGGRLT